MGHGSVVWNVPMLAQTGTYRFLVISNGINVTEASVSIVFDDVTYLRWRVDNVEQDNSQLREIVKRTVIELNDINGRIFWMWAAASITCGFAVCFGLITILYYQDEMVRKAKERVHRRNKEGKKNDLLLALTDPHIDGLLIRPCPTVLSAYESAKEPKERMDRRPKALIPNDESPTGYDEIPAKLLEETVAEPEALDLKEPVVKMNIISKIRHRLERKKKVKTPSKDERIESLVAELERLKKEQRPETPERSEQSPSPSPAVGTTPEKPQDAVPVVIEEEVPKTVENAPKPRKKASAKPKSTKPRAKKAESVKEAAE
jgi:hypothetical protein